MSKAEDSPEQSYYDSSLESQAVTQYSDTTTPKNSPGRRFSPFHYNTKAFLITAIAFSLIILIGVGSLLLISLRGNKQNALSAAQKATDYSVSSLSTQGVQESTQLKVGQADHLAINGQLQVSNTLVLSPTSVPTNPVAGQIYYNETTNQPYYYNGSQFISLSPTAVPQHITSLGGAVGVIGLGSSLSITGNQLAVSSSILQEVTNAGLNSTRVISLQGLSGNVTLTAGPGIAISGTTITNSGVVSLASGSSNLTVTNDGSGNYTISNSNGGNGEVDLGPTSAQVDNSNNSSISINKTGTGDLLELANNGVDSFVVNQTGQITTGTINFSQVQGVPAIVNTIGGVSGSLSLGGGLSISGVTLSNDGVLSLTGTANQVTVSASTGAVTLSLPQDINTGATPSFAGLTLGSALSVSSGGTSVTLGVAGTTAGALNLANTTNTNLGILQAAAPSGTGNATYILPTIPGGSSDTVCLVNLGNCLAGGSSVTTTNGTQGYITKYNNLGATQITSSEIYDSGSGISIGSTSPVGLFNVGNGDQFQVSSSGAVTAVGINSGAGLIQGADGLAVTGNSTIAGTLGSLTGLTSSGTITFSGLNAVGVVHTNGSGVLSTSAVVLGIDTTGAYVANLGSLVGLSTTGNSGAGSTPSLSVLYGSASSTAAQGNSALSFTGSGNLTGTVSGTAGGGFTSNTLAVVNSPTFSGTLTVQGSSVTVGTASQAGSLILNDGNGLSNNTATLQAFATLGQNTVYTLPDPGSGSATICISTGNCAGSGGGVTGSGNSGDIALFNGSNSITNSANLSESGSVVTDSGSLAIQGASGLNLGTGSGNNGQIVFNNSTNNNTLTLQSGVTASNLVFTLPTADGSNGDCLETDGHGNLSLDSCTGGAGGGVTSLDNQSGIVTLANSSGSGGTVTINNASTTAQGIAEFNSTNFSASGGTIDTIQDIAISSSPVFATVNGTTGINTGSGSGTQRIDSSGDLVNIGTIATSGTINTATISGGSLTATTVNGLDVSSSAIDTASAGALSIGAANATLTIGSTGNALTLQGNASSVLTATGGGFTSTVGFTGTPTASQTFVFDRTIAAGTWDICTSSGNCLGGAGGGANTALSNLNAVAINASLVPGISNSINVGSSSLLFANGYFATGLQAPLLETAPTGTASTNSVALNLQTGNATGATSNSGNLTIDTGTATGTTGTIAIGTSNASGTTIGRAANGITLTLQGGAGSTLSGTNATGTTALGFAAPSTAGTVTFQLPAGGTGGNTYSICTTLTVCAGYDPAPANAYIQLAPSSAQVDTSTNSSIFINKTALSGNLLQLEAGSSPQFTVGYTGAVTAGTINTATISGGSLTATTVNGLDVSSSAIDTASAGALSIGAANATLTIGSTGNALTLQGNASSVLTATGGGFTSTVGFTGTPTASQTFVFDRTIAAGTWDICTSSGNCLGGAGGGANTALSNLNAVAINASLVPGISNSINVGSSSLLFANGYFATGLQAPLLQSASGQALTITANAASTWSTSAGNLTIQAAGGSTLALDTSSTGGAVTVAANDATTLTLGNTGATVSINSGATLNIGNDAVNKTIDIGVSSSANSSAVNIGNTNSSTTTTIQTGAVSENLTNTGDTIETTANSTTTFQVQNTSSQDLIQADTTDSLVALDSENASSTGGATDTWATNTNHITTALACSTSVTANGYVYVIGGASGSNGCQNGTNNSTVYYAQLNANGSTGAWTTNANPLPAAVSCATSVVVSGYVYVMGGSTGSGCTGTAASTVYYAQLNANGSTGAWTTNANALPAARCGATSVTANGYIYVMGGASGNCGGSAANQSTVYYAQINANGSTGAWTTNANALPATLVCATSVTANGYIYVMGGASGNGCGNSTVVATVYYAQLTSTGATGTWSTNTNALPQALDCATSVTANGYVYVLGGSNSGSGSCYNNKLSTVYYASLNSSTGAVGSWSTNANPLTVALTCATSVIANGYIYEMGGVSGISGCAGTPSSTVYYASLARVTVDASLDLVDLQGGTLSNPGDQSTGSVGGSLTAGNGQFVGSLQVQGQTSLAQGLVVDGNVTADGSAYFQDLSGSTNAFEVQNTTGTQVLNVNTVTTPNLIANGDFETTTDGWSGKGSATIAQNNTAAIGAAFGTGSLAITTTATIGDGASYSYTLAASTQYTLSLYARSSSGTVSTINIGRQEVSGTDIDCLTAQTLTTTWTRYVCTFTTGATITAPTQIYIKQTDATARTFYIDGVQLEKAATASAFQTNQVNLQVTPVISALTLDGNNSGATGPWTTNANTLPANLACATSVTANGYIYEIGGVSAGAGCAGSTALATVYYAPVNADGSTGAWTTNANPLPVSRACATSVVASGYIYVMGGTTAGTGSCYGGSLQSTVYYARLNPNGSTGTWSTDTNALPAALACASSVTANGYIYEIGGSNGSPACDGGGVATVYYAQVNANGSTSAWTTSANPLTTAVTCATSVVANGYVYVMGGSGGNCRNGGTNTTVYYASLNSSTGANSAWTTSATSLPITSACATSVVSNGYVYYMGGATGSGCFFGSTSTTESTVYYASLNSSTGATGAWSTNANAMPATLACATSVVVNGYIYEIGGTTGPSSNTCDSAPVNTVYYASLARVTVDASLDLVGAQGGTLSTNAGDQSTGSTGGSLTAGNGLFVGSLQVQGQTSLAQSLTVGGNVTGNGSAFFQNSTNSTSAFQVNNSSGSSLLTGDTTNMRLGVDATYASMSAPTQNATSTATTGGTLAATTYYYKITAIDSTGGETTPSAEQSQVTTGSTSTVTLSWVPVAHATGYKIYRGTTALGGSGSEVYLTTTIGIANSTNLNYTDTGSITAGAATPPTSDTAYTPTNTSNNNLQLSVGGNGTPTSQLYVSGTVPTAATGSVATSNSSESVYVSGRYAYVVNTNNTLQIFDVSNPASPLTISTATTGSTPSSVYVSGRYAYVTDKGANTLQIFDVSNPASPVSVGTVSTGASSSPEDVYVSGRYAYVTNSGTATLQIFDVSNPASPVSVGTVTTGTSPWSIYVSGRYAYVANEGSATLQIFNVSNPASPVSVGTVTTSTNPESVYVQGSYAYVATEGSGKLQVFDVSNPASPVNVGSISTLTNAFSVYVSGRYAFVLSGSSLQIFDVSNPASPVSVGNISSVGSNPSSVYVSGRYAYVASGLNKSLNIYDIGGAYIQQLQTGGLEAATLQVDTDATISGDEYIQGGVQIGADLQVAGNAGINGNLNLTASTISAPSAPTLTTAAGTGSLPATTTYYYDLAATTANGNTAAVASSPTSRTTGGTASNQNTLTWTAVTGATGYIVYESTNGTTWFSNEVSSNVTSIIDNGTNFTWTNQVTPPTTATTGGNLTVGGTALFQDASTSTTAFQIENTAGTNNIFTADTVNNIVTIGSSTIGETVNIGTGVSGANNQGINIGSNASAGTGVETITIGNTNTGTNGSTIVNILAGNNSGSTTTGQSTGINVSLGSTASTTAVCSSLANATNPTSGTAYQLEDCSGTPVADYAEEYPVAPGATAGEVVATGTQMVNTYGTEAGNSGVIDWNNVIGQVTQLVPSTQAYQSDAIGVISDNNDDFSSTGYNIATQDNPMPVALNGRVLVNVSTENGPIEPGDYLTTSATMPGYAMKATQAGYVIGRALASYTSSTPGQVMVFVGDTYYPGPSPSSYIQNGGNATLSSLTVGGSADFSDLNASGTATINNLTVTGAATINTLSVTGSTTLATLEVSGTAQFDGNITIDGHIITGGGQPTAQPQTAAGSQATVTVSGTDTTGTITITTGTDPTAGSLADIVFSQAYGAPPHVVLSPSNSNAAALPYFKGNTNTTDFLFNVIDNPAPSTTYQYDYFIGQ